MQEKGILPPDKPRLNRKKFVEEAKQEWNQRDTNCMIWNSYIINAISLILGKKDTKFNVHPEAVGAAKILKLAIRLKKFDDKRREENRVTYKLSEQYEFIKDILDA